MGREKEIEILMKDGCTRKEAEKALERGTTIYSEIEIKNEFDSIFEYCLDEEEKEPFRKMIRERIPAEDWGICECDGYRWFIEYVN